jgi:hypothetical protein
MISLLDLRLVVDLDAVLDVASLLDNEPAIGWNRNMCILKAVMRAIWKCLSKLWIEIAFVSFEQSAPQCSSVAAWNSAAHSSLANEQVVKFVGVHRSFTTCSPFKTWHILWGVSVSRVL